MGSEMHLDMDFALRSCFTAQTETDVVRPGIEPAIAHDTLWDIRPPVMFGRHRGIGLQQLNLVSRRGCRNGVGATHGGDNVIKKSERASRMRNSLIR